jgi:hypothetical protein
MIEENLQPKIYTPANLNHPIPALTNLSDPIAFFYYPDRSIRVLGEYNTFDRD